MLSNRLKISDTANMLSPYYRTSTATAALALKLNISDTATMLTPFVQYSDTANQTSGYLRKNFALLLQDTASALSNRLKISDTLTMLSPYARTSNLPSLTPYLLKADSLSGGYTTWLLTKKKVDSLGAVITAANSIKKDISDTLFNNGYTTRIRTKTGLDSLAAVFNAANALKKNVADTFFTTGYTTRARTKQYGDSIAAVKLNISDTLTMLSNRLRISDTATMLSNRLRISDTLTMLSRYLRRSDTLNMLSPYRRTSTLIQQSEVSGLSTSLAAKLNVSDTNTMLSNYRRSSTLILNSNLANSTISGVALGGNLNNHLNGYGISGTAYNGALTQTWIVDTTAISTKANVTGALVSKLNISDTTTMLSNYARKSGTAFTGAISGTSSTWSGNLITNGEAQINPSSGDATLRLLTGSTERATIKANATKFFIEVGTFGERFSINNSTGLLTHTGAATITDVLNATGEITSGSASRAFLRQTVGGDVEVGSKAGGTTAIYSNNTAAVTFGLTQAATFSSSVTASSLIKSGGTSSQFLKADGSVDGSTYVNTSSTQSVGGNKTFTSSTVFAGVRFAYSSVSSNYTLTDNDDYVVVTNTSTVTLPTAVGRAGKRYVLRSTVGSGVSSSLTTTSGQTIDGIIGPFSFGFGNYNILIVFSDGSNWFSETFITGG